MDNLSKIKETMHSIVAELIEHLFLSGVHNINDVQKMSDRLHEKIDAVGTNG